MGIFGSLVGNEQNLLGEEHFSKGKYFYSGNPKVPFDFFILKSKACLHVI